MNSRLYAPAAVTLLLVGCSNAGPQTVTPTAPSKGAQAAEQGCYQTSWWAETSGVIYRRFDEEHMPHPARGDNQPAAAMEECP